MNYLVYVYEMYDAETEVASIADQLEMHKLEIEKNLEQELPDSVHRKYQWAARYHDYFCDESRDLLNCDLSISVDYEKERFTTPRRLLDVFPSWLS
ncbi:MAG: hypothetical protein IJ087_12730 [Eggerthellaceae bacterium]|nr:hypothetical protein [Eggerthellaceae bacterium]